MSNLIIPSKINATAPKPTKTQLVEALLIKAKELHDKEEERKEKAVKELQKQLLEVGVKELLKCNPSKLKLSRQAWNNTASIDFSLTSPQCKKLLKLLEDNKREYFNEKDAKEKIMEALKPANPLLGNSVVKKSLEDLCHSIFNNINTVEAIEA
jgi:hypothetical protein